MKLLWNHRGSHPIVIRTGGPDVHIVHRRYWGIRFGRSAFIGLVKDL